MEACPPLSRGDEGKCHILYLCIAEMDLIFYLGQVI